MKCGVISYSECPLKHFNSLWQAIKVMMIIIAFFLFDRSVLQSNVPSPPSEGTPAHLEDTEYSFKRLEWDKFSECLNNSED